jgi:predicted lipoprotein with Yx(FWY)xxD motif
VGRVFRTGPAGRPAMLPLTGRMLAPVAALLLVSGCASASAQGSPAGPAHAHGGQAVTVMARSLPGLGTVLVTSKGYALYMFDPDNHRTVTCTGACAGTWPPLMLPSGAGLAAGHGVQSSLLGADPDPAGGRVVTYDGWPLYTYTGDVQPGQATGQDIDLNGGEWYVMRQSGAPLIPAP